MASGPPANVPTVRLRKPLVEALLPGLQPVWSECQDELNVQNSRYLVPAGTDLIFAIYLRREALSEVNFRSPNPPDV